MITLNLSGIALFEFPITENELNSLTENDLDKIILLEKNGLLIGSSETIEDYKKRLYALINELSDLNKNLNEKNNFEIYKSLILQKNRIILPDHFIEAAKLTSRYSFSIKWAPGFFAEKPIGLLTGGFTLLSDLKLPIFVLKSCFSKKIKWLWYNRIELLAHELCHVARSPLDDNSFEEFFAYNISFSKLRRYIGSCFRTPLDSILLIVPFLILLIMEFIKVLLIPTVPMLYFWLFCFIYPAFLLIKNHFTRKKYFKAKANLKYSGLNEIESDSVLFRCNTEEIKDIARFTLHDKQSIKNYINSKAAMNLKWKVIAKRFIKFR